MGNARMFPVNSCSDNLRCLRAESVSPSPNPTMTGAATAHPTICGVAAPNPRCPRQIRRFVANVRPKCRGIHSGNTAVGTQALFFDHAPRACARAPVPRPRAGAVSTFSARSHLSTWATACMIPNRGPQIRPRTTDPGQIYCTCAAKKDIDGKSWESV